LRQFERLVVQEQRCQVKESVQCAFLQSRQQWQRLSGGRPQRGIDARARLAQAAGLPPTADGIA
jgi:hypothetical protein